MLAAAAVATTTNPITIRCSIGTASDITGNGEGTHRIDDGLRLRDVAQLELFAEGWVSNSQAEDNPWQDWQQTGGIGLPSFGAAVELSA